MCQRVDPNGMTPPRPGVGLLYLRWINGNRLWGTGALISNQHILTCSHNLVDREGNGTVQRIWFFPGWNTTATLDPAKGHEIAKAIYHSKYREGEEAWDVGLCRLPQPVQVDPRNFFTPVEPVDYEEDSDVQLTGYPVNRQGEMWQDSSTINNMDVETNSMFYDHDVSGGNSGSPVWQNADNQTNQYGIHVSREGELKEGLLITSAVKSWIKRAREYSDALPGNNQLGGTLLYGFE
jgi:V8-like Glu-specific endopeptidase